VETLYLLEALDPDRSLSRVGRMMAIFPLIPRHSRIIVEAILRYPEVLEEVLIAASFLTGNSPFLLPQGEELAARRAHHSFQDPSGDFVSYLKIFRAYERAERKDDFCKKHYLDERIMGEIVNVKEQLALIVGDMGVPVTSGGSMSDYLSAIAKGLIQFVCVRTGRGVYRRLPATSWRARSSGPPGCTPARCRRWKKTASPESPPPCPGAWRRRRLSRRVEDPGTVNRKKPPGRKRSGKPPGRSPSGGRSSSSNPTKGKRR